MNRFLAVALWVFAGGAALLPWRYTWAHEYAMATMGPPLTEFHAWESSVFVGGIRVSNVIPVIALLVSLASRRGAMLRLWSSGYATLHACYCVVWPGSISHPGLGAFVCGIAGAAVLGEALVRGRPGPGRVERDVDTQ